MHDMLVYILYEHTYWKFSALQIQKVRGRE